MTLDIAHDPYNLHRFVAAQEDSYSTALAEIRGARKQSHWMWYVFPQYAGLGISATSKRYAIQSLEEAQAYLQHPLLGARLLECASGLLDIDGRTAHQIFGSPDDLKLRSCATLFARVSLPGSAFEQLLAKYFDGQPDEQTLHLLHVTPKPA